MDEKDDFELIHELINMQEEGKISKFELAMILADDPEYPEVIKEARGRIEKRKDG